MQSKTEILNENSLLDEKLFKDSLKTEDTTSQIISFLPKEAIKENALQKALSSFVFNKNCYYANQPQRLEDAFVRYVYKDNQKTVKEMLMQHPEFKIHQLLGYIASGNQDEAEKMLKEHPELLLQSGSVIDPSGRLFKNIKPFELLIWTMDVRYMANMVLDCVRRAEKGDEIRIELLKQYKAVVEDFDAEKKTGGVHYTLNGEKHHEKHFDFQPLIKALDTYVKNYDSWSYEKCVDYWCKEVGKEQFKLTIEARNQYCHLTRSFDPVPDFNEEHLVRNLKFYNYVTNREQIWGSRLVGLGTDFGILRGAALGLPARPRGAGGGRWARIDLTAISRLCEVRTEDLMALKERLVLSIQKSEEIQKSRQMIY